MSMVEIKKKKKKHAKNSRIGKKAEIRGNAENFHACKDQILCLCIHYTRVKNISLARACLLKHMVNLLPSIHYIVTCISWIPQQRFYRIRE